MVRCRCCAAIRRGCDQTRRRDLESSRRTGAWAAGIHRCRYTHGRPLTSPRTTAQLAHGRRQSADVRPTGGTPGARCAVGRARTSPGPRGRAGRPCRPLPRRLARRIVVEPRSPAQPVLRLRSAERLCGRTLPAGHAMLPGVGVRRPGLSSGWTRVPAGLGARGVPHRAVRTAGDRWCGSARPQSKCSRRCRSPSWAAHGSCRLPARGVNQT